MQTLSAWTLHRHYVFDIEAGVLSVQNTSGVEVDGSGVHLGDYQKKEYDRIEIDHPVIKLYREGEVDYWNMMSGERIEPTVTVVVRRLITGLGDAVTVEPVMRKLCEKGEIPGILTKYPEVFENSYFVLDDLPSGVPVIELGDPCPAGHYEYYSNPKIDKSRVQLFLESAGLDFEDDVPVIGIGKEESDDYFLKIGVAIVSARYNNELDGWRDYPYQKEVLELLKGLGEVTWFHTEPSGVEDVEDFEGDLRSLIKRVSEMDFMLTVDSGVAHVAGALSVPQYSLVGPTYPMKLIGYPNVRTPPDYTECGMQPCWYSPCRGRYCLSTLSPRFIFEEMESMIREFFDDRTL